MILYKYMSFLSAAQAIKNSTIGFSCIEDLNDPFEGAALCFEDSEEVPSSLQRSASFNRLSRKFGVLSLTRNPFNALMWSHYGDDHRGVVLGIDIDLANLNDLEKCIIPAKFGEIIYTTTIPRNYLPASSVEQLLSIGENSHHFFEHEHELFKNTFLYKDSAWAYEEEVRVVKNIVANSCQHRHKNTTFENSSGDWIQIYLQDIGRPLYCLKLPKESIVEAYLGCKSYSNVSRLGLDKAQYLETRSEWVKSGIKTRLVKQSKTSWNLEISNKLIE